MTHQFKKKLATLFVCAVMLLSGLVASSGFLSTAVSADTAAEDACTKSEAATFFGLPVWYRGLGKPYVLPSGQAVCNVDITAKGDWQSGVLTVGVNVLDDLLRLAGLLSVIFIIIGGFRYITSQGEAAGITAAKQTIVRAISGLIIAILAVLILNFIAGSVFKLTVNQDNYNLTNNNDGSTTNSDAGSSPSGSSSTTKRKAI